MAKFWSNEKEHSLYSGHPIIENDFQILDCCDNLDIRTVESLYIQRLPTKLRGPYTVCKIKLLLVRTI